MKLHINHKPFTLTHSTALWPNPLGDYLDHSREFYDQLRELGKGSVEAGFTKVYGAPLTRYPGPEYNFGVWTFYASNLFLEHATVYVFVADGKGVVFEYDERSSMRELAVTLRHHIANRVIAYDPQRRIDSDFI